MKVCGQGTGPVDTELAPDDDTYLHLSLFDPSGPRHPSLSSSPSSTLGAVLVFGSSWTTESVCWPCPPLALSPTTTPAMRLLTFSIDEDDIPSSDVGTLPLVATVIIFSVSLFGNPTDSCTEQQPLTPLRSVLLPDALQAHLLPPHPAHRLLRRQALWYRCAPPSPLCAGYGANRRRAGVILSTAFVHLLQDAFESLLDPRLRRLTVLGEWVGLLVYAAAASSTNRH
jgi:hypothetical protein